MGIGGNIAADFQIFSSKYKNEIGEREPLWVSAATLFGWLDLTSGDAKYTNYSSKLQESTHVFICDYVPITAFKENKRLIVDGNTYDVLLVDDPMGMHQQLEIYLKYTGR